MHFDNFCKELKNFLVCSRKPYEVSAGVDSVERKLARLDRLRRRNCVYRDCVYC